MSTSVGSHAGTVRLDIFMRLRTSRCDAASAGRKVGTVPVREEQVDGGVIMQRLMLGLMAVALIAGIPAGGIASTASNTCDGLTPTIVGTAGDDKLVGTTGDDVIAALQGNDVVIGQAGSDIVCGGNGEDTLLGGYGDDVLHGGNGDDSLLGGSDEDTLQGGKGVDVAYGIAGDDG